MSASADFKAAAQALADRLEAMPPQSFFRWRTQAANGTVTLPEVDYDPIALEWIELLAPFGLIEDSEAYEAVARRGWDNAGLIATSSFEDTVRIASTLVRAQRSTGQNILDRAHQQGMLAAILRRLSELSGG
jgi:hypothetical protein